MKRLFFIFSMFVSLASYAQVNEICNNGFDDDLDGFVDCFDNSCATNTLCDGSYIGNDIACQVDPGPATQFTMALDWESPNEMVNHLNRVSIGDLDRDGIPEVIAINISTSKINILNGNGGGLLKSISVNYSIERDPIIGNIDNDGCAEIFTYGSKDGTWKIYAYDCDLNLLWSSPAGSEMRGNPFYLSLADFDGDGKVELYYKDEIVDAHTGVKIITTKQSLNTAGTGVVDSKGNPRYDFNYLAAPVAADIVGDKNLELIAGCRIYSVNLGTRTFNSGSLTLLDKHDDFRIKGEESSTTSVADYNLDGFLDVLTTGSRYTGATDRANITQQTGINTTLFFWDVKNATLKTYIDAFNTDVSVFDCKDGVPGAVSTGKFYANGWRNGTGRINIADIDGDGKLNAAYVSGKFLYALDENFNQKWRIVVNEETSGYTGCTMFDFNGDGKTEIVYRDEKFVYIIYGDGTVSNQQKCISRTNREYPIVADVDADGSTEICVTCASDDNLTDAEFCEQGSSTGRQQYSVVRAFKSATEPWVPARRLWNQHGYFNVNVNDDLSIPKQQQLSQKLFFTGACRPGDPVKSIRPLNSFLNQSPFLDSRGCPQYAAPNLEIKGTIVVTQPTCPDKDFTVQFDLTNKGDLSINGDVPITFYKGDPRIAGAIKLNTVLQTLVGFNLDAVATVTATVKGDGSNFVLFIAVNDAGTDTAPITLPNTNFLECSYDFYSAQVSPLPVSVTTTSKPNVQCVTSAVSANGSVTASIIVNGNNITSAFNFYWSDGTVAKPIPADYLGATYTGLVEQDYTVFARHKTANCASDTKTQTVVRTDGDVDVQVVLDAPYTNCKIPNGALRAIVNGGDPVNNFTYAWYLGSLPFNGSVLSVSHIATGLAPNTYTVLVTDKVTNCQTFSNLTINDNTVKPVATAVPTDILCNAATSGSITAQITGGPSGFNYKWYKGNAVKPSPDFSGSNAAGSVYSSLAAGNYVLVVENNTTKCDSDPVPVVVKQTTAPVLNNPTVVSANTSCDALLPNGSASASVQSPVGGHTYTFEWFKGQNTLVANLVKTEANVTTSTATGLATGIFTVKLTDNFTGCSATKEVTINFNAVTPALILAAIGDMTNCTTPNGSVTVNVTIDTPSDYTFSWYKGTVVKAIPDFTDTDNKLEGLPIGKYTVKAVHNSRHCATGPITAEVKDNTPIISIVLDAAVTQAPSDCNSNNGIMKVDVSAPGNVNGFRIEWYKGVAPFTTPIQPAALNAFTSTASNIKSGIYTVVATNMDNGCVASKAFNLPFLFAHELNYISQIDVNKCAPTNVGSVNVQLVKTATTVLESFVESDYTIEIRSGTDETGPLVELPRQGTDNVLTYNFGSLSPGFYHLIAISSNPLRSTHGCKSVPVIIEIKQNVVNPLILSTAINTNTNCAGATSNGSIQLSIDGGAPVADYSYAWFEGSAITDPVLGTTPGTTTGGSGEIAQNLPGGFYTVQVTNTSAINTACAAVATFQVFDNPPIISMSSADVVITDAMLCNNPTGTATVNNITEDGTAIPVNANYAFEWYNSSMSILPNNVTPNTTNTIANLAVGTYSVKVRKTASPGMNCFSADVGFEIKDKTMNTVGVDLVNFVLPTRCLKPANVLGELTTVATGNSTAPIPYTYNWYIGTGTTTPLPTTTGPNGETAQTLVAGTFTVEVINNSNNCSVTDTYTIPQQIALINLTASSLPITFCVPNPLIDDGVVNAAVISVTNNNSIFSDSGLPALYSYLWTGPSGSFSDLQTYKFQSKGDYTVKAVDKTDAFCETAPISISIMDETVYPIVTAIPTLPVSNCDPTIPNGMASANVGGDVFDYTFDWYEGAVTTPASPNFVVQGPEASNLKPSLPPANTFYTVEAKNRVTQCGATATVQIEFKPEAVPPPSVELVSDVTNCIVPNTVYVPNGSLKVVVDRPVDYTFAWTKTGDASFAATSEIISNLDEGTYSVTALNNATHCSATATGTIGVNRVLPTFDFATVAASCGEENGFASLFITNTIQIGDITWSLNGTDIAQGPILSEVVAGTYHVVVKTASGCVAEQDVPIGTEIHPYNGISRNNDGKNEIFYINCIDNFPGNLVKIYNRAGTLVYEATNYNNIDIYFDGKSNKGVSVLGTNLPDGTYFYIIDKRNGSKRFAGYLEIVN